LVLIRGQETAQTWIQIRSGVLCQNTPDLIIHWIQIMQQKVYEYCMNSVDELKQRLVDVWNNLQHDVIDAAINEWRKRRKACVQMDNILNIYYMSS